MDHVCSWCGMHFAIHDDLILHIHKHHSPPHHGDSHIQHHEDHAHHHEGKHTQLHKDPRAKHHLRALWVLALLTFSLALAPLGTMGGKASATQMVTNTGATGYEPSVSGSIIAFFTYEIEIGQDFNGNGIDWEQVVRYYDISTGLVRNVGMGGAPSVSGSIIAFGTHEQELGQDLNGDGHLGGYVIRYYDISTRSVINTGLDGNWPSVSGSIIAFSSHESELGQDVDGDGALQSVVVRYYDISTRSVANIPTFGWGPSISGSIIAFGTPEYYAPYSGPILNQDLNGDGDVLDNVIRYYDISTGLITNTRTAGGLISISGSIIAFNDWQPTGENWIKYYDVLTGSTTNTGAFGFDASISGSIIAFSTDEYLNGQDLNGDGDLDDRVTLYYDISTGLVTNTGEPGDWPSVSGSILAFSTYEGFIGQDLNGNGDQFEGVIRYITIEGTTAIKTISDKIDSFVASRAIDNRGVAESLKAFLDQAQAKIDQGSISSAKNILNAFISYAMAQSGKHITADATQALIDSANNVMNSL